MESIEIVNNEKRLRFETPVDDEFAFVDYRWHEGKLVFMHTFVPEAGKGKGIANALAEFVLEYAKTKGLKIIVYCPFIAAYLKKHPAYNVLTN